jgi:hypothetical protein
MWGETSNEMAERHRLAREQMERDKRLARRLFPLVILMSTLIGLSGAVLLFALSWKVLH